MPSCLHSTWRNSVNFNEFPFADSSGFRPSWQSHQCHACQKQFVRTLTDKNKQDEMLTFIRERTWSVQVACGDVCVLARNWGDTFSVRRYYFKNNQEYKLGRNSKSKKKIKRDEIVNDYYFTIGEKNRSQLNYGKKENLKM